MMVFRGREFQAEKRVTAMEVGASLVCLRDSKMAVVEQ